MLTKGRTMVRGRFARLMLLALPTLLVLVCVGGTTAIAMSVQRDGIRAATAERVTDVSSELAGLEQVRDALENLDSFEQATAELQPLASLVERAAGVDYVVVIAPDERRITHPTPTERGRAVSTDATAVLAARRSSTRWTAPSAARSARRCPWSDPMDPSSVPCRRGSSSGA